VLFFTEDTQRDYFMPESQQSWIAELVGPIIDAWLHRDERKAAKDAGELTFWRSGMLKHLEAIADGKANKETFNALSKEFDATSERVNLAMQRLKEARSRIVDRKIADQIDKVLHDFRFGKSAIRSEIQVIISLGEEGEKDRAKRELCGKLGDEMIRRRGEPAF
jgi:hypothetical protein